MGVFRFGSCLLLGADPEVAAIVDVTGTAHQRHQRRNNSFVVFLLYLTESTPSATRVDHHLSGYKNGEASSTFAPMYNTHDARTDSQKLVALTRCHAFVTSTC